MSLKFAAAKASSANSNDLTNRFLRHDAKLDYAPTTFSHFNDPSRGTQTQTPGVGEFGYHSRNVLSLDASPAQTKDAVASLLSSAAVNTSKSKGKMGKKGAAGHSYNRSR